MTTKTNIILLPCAMLMVGCAVGSNEQGDAAVADDAGATQHDSGGPNHDGGPHADAGQGNDAGPPVDAGNPPPDASTTIPYLHASGGSLIDGQGNTIQLHGVNRSGTEYACVQGWGLFDGPSDDNSLAAIAAWKNVNAVRVPLNEDCWLGINGVSAAYGGSNYQSAISGFVDRILAHGLYPILDLHWTAPGTTVANQQVPMPDQDHSPTFWSQVATMFANRPNVVLELFNEPWPDNNQDSTAAWTCWENGGSCSGVSYQVAGMSTLLTAVRNAGANNFVLMGGVQYSNALSQWVSHVPSDPLKNVGAAWHVYNFNVCNNINCYNNTAGAVLAQYPVVTTEIGEDDCTGNFISGLMTWLDGKQQSYLAWTWNTWGNCMSLISNFSGTATSPYGTTYQGHVSAL